MNTLTDLLLGVGQPRVSHFPDLCTLLYTYLSTLDYWTKIVYYLFTQTSPVAHTSALTPTYIKSQKLPNWPISKELGLGRMLLPHWKLLFNHWWPLSFALLQHSSMPADNQLGGHGDMWSHCFPEGIVNAASPNHLWFQCLGQDADLQINSNGSNLIQNWNCPIFLQVMFFLYLLPDRKYE